MSQSATGPGGTPPVPDPNVPRGFEKVEFAFLKIPFRFKVAVVWIAIFLILAVLFAMSKFDTEWMFGGTDPMWLFIMKGIWATIIIAVVSITLAVALALVGALGRLSKNSIAYGVSGFYTSFFRGTPLIVQMFLIYSALPQMVQDASQGVRDLFTLETYEAGILALGLNYGAYMTEIFRAGIQSVAHGQGEAAQALGMTSRQAMRRVVLPQATRVIIPPTGNEFIAMIKDTALVSLLGSSIAFMEIFRRSQLMGKADFRNMEALILAAAMYWGLTAIFTFFQAKLERRMGKGYVRGGGASGPKFVSGAPGGGPGGGARMAEIPEGGDH